MLCPGMGDLWFSLGLRWDQDLPWIFQSQEEDGLEVCILRKGMEDETCSWIPQNLDLLSLVVRVRVPRVRGGL